MKNIENNDFSCNVIDDNLLEFDIIEPPKESSSLLWLINRFNNVLKNENKDDKLSDIRIEKLIDRMAEVITGKLYIIYDKNKVYNIFKYKNDESDFIIIDSSEKTKDAVIGNTLELLPDEKFKFQKTIKAFDMFQSSAKFFCNDQDIMQNYLKDRTNGNKKCNYVNLKEDALKDIIKLLEDLEKIDCINDIISINNLYNDLGLISKNSINPVACNKELIISKDDNKKFYDIIKTKTQEVIGNIESDNYNNYNYSIKDDFKDDDINVLAFQMFHKIISESNTKGISKIKKDQ